MNWLIFYEICLIYFLFNTKIFKFIYKNKNISFFIYFYEKNILEKYIQTFLYENLFEKYFENCIQKIQKCRNDKKTVK